MGILCTAIISPLIFLEGMAVHRLVHKQCLTLYGHKFGRSPLGFRLSFISNPYLF